MSDFEDRLTAALTDGAEDAPGVVGLADGARRRAAVRRRRRVAVGAVVAVLAVVVPLGVVRGLAGGDRDNRDVADAGPGWKTVTFDYEPHRPDRQAGTVLVDVPEDWAELEGTDKCPGRKGWGEPGRDDLCAFGESMVFLVDGGNLDNSFGPGLRPASDFGDSVSSDWIGYVDPGGFEVSVSTDDGQLALRVLGSVRFEDEDVPDLSQPWVTIRQDGLDFPVPAGLAGDVEVVVDEIGETADGAWSYDTELADGRTVRVSAPTLALAQTIGGSSRPAGESAGDTWVTVTLDGVAVDVPDTWSELDPEADHCLTDRGAEVGPPRPNTSGIHPCDAARSVIVVADSVNVPECCPSADLDGAVHVGNRLVVPQNLDAETARRVLASARPAGTEAPDVAEWETITVADSRQPSLLVDVPTSGVIDIKLLEGFADCAQKLNPAGPNGEGWRAGYCGLRYADVYGPTQALTDLVLRSIRPAAEPSGSDQQWTTLTVADVSVDVPAGWREIECGATRRLQPQGDTCGSDGPRATLIDEASTFYLGPSLRERAGSVVAGSQIVSVSDAPFETVRRILASARPAGTDAPDVAGWREIELDEGVIAVVPDEDSVRVAVSGGIPECATEQTRARPARYGRWQVGLCRDRIVTVTAPTQALADVVALQVDGY